MGHEETCAVISSRLGKHGDANARTPDVWSAPGFLRSRAVRLWTYAQVIGMGTQGLSHGSRILSGIGAPYGGVTT